MRGSGAYLPEGVVEHVADANLRWRTFPIYLRALSVPLVRDSRFSPKWKGSQWTVALRI